jgi:hypothetical protein
MKSGDTFLMPAPGISSHTPHLWIVITDPGTESQVVVIVSITTLRHRAEQTMVLRAGEHPFIDRDSSVCYTDARLVDASDLDNKAKMGQIKTHAPCPAKTLGNVRAGILASELTPQKVQRFYQSTLNRPK